MFTPPHQSFVAPNEPLVSARRIRPRTGSEGRRTFRSATLLISLDFSGHLLVY